MDRRRFVLTSLVGALGAPLAAEAQTGRVYRIGYLAQDNPGDFARPLEGFRQGLRELGYVEGQNLIIEYRWAELNFARLPGLAAELVRLKVEVIAAVATRAIEAARQATTSAPIVMTLTRDAVESGFVTNLGHPGGNITGMTGVTAETSAKRLELLKEALPRASHVAVLWNPTSLNRRPEPQWRELEIAAPRVGLTLHSVEVRTLHEFEGAFASIARSRWNAVLVLSDPLTTAHRERIARLASSRRLPTMYGLRQYVEAGGLMAYGPSLFDSSRRA